MKLYLDTVATIFLVEKVSPFYEIILEKISHTQAKIVVSEMNRLECRVKPLKTKDLALLKDFDDFFESEPYKIVPISRKVIDKATTLRATYSFKTPDSIHLAAAIFSRCKTFLTHDTELKRCAEIQVELISDLMQT